MREVASMRRPVGAMNFAIILGWLGVAGALNTLIWPVVRNSELMNSAPPEFAARFPSSLGSWWFSLLALSYGVTALATARGIWRLSPAARPSYVAWSTTVLLLMLTLSVSTPGISFFSVAVVLIPLLALLAAGWLATRRLVQP